MKAQAKKMRRHTSRATLGSGNVFADLGLPNPEQELLKAQLTLQIYTILKGNGMTQVEIAKILGVREPQVNRPTRMVRPFLFFGYGSGSMLRTWIVSVWGSRVPVTFTFCPANGSARSCLSKW